MKKLAPGFQDVINNAVSLANFAAEINAPLIST